MTSLADIDLKGLKISKMLIEEVKKHPILYDESIEGYRENDLKVVVWEEIARQVVGENSELAVDMVRTRWKNIRWACKKSYQAFKVKQKRGIKVKPFRFAKDMTFLFPHYKDRKKGPYDDIWNDTISEDLDVETEVPDVYDKNENVQLIRAVRKYPILWDKDQTGTIGKQTAWKKVGKEINSNASSSNVKWKNLKYRFLKALEEQRENLENGITEQQPPIYYNELRFLLKNSGDVRTSKRSPSKRELEDDLNETGDDPLLGLMETDEIDESNDEVLVCKQEYIADDEAIEISRQYTNNNDTHNIQQNDDVIDFFLTMGKMVKKLKIVNQIFIKKTIANVVLDMELREAQDFRNNY